MTDAKGTEPIADDDKVKKPRLGVLGDVVQFFGPPFDKLPPWQPPLNFGPSEPFQTFEAVKEAANKAGYSLKLVANPTFGGFAAGGDGGGFTEGPWVHPGPIKMKPGFCCKVLCCAGVPMPQHFSLALPPEGLQPEDVPRAYEVTEAVPEDKMRMKIDVTSSEGNTGMRGRVGFGMEGGCCKGHVDDVTVGQHGTLKYVAPPACCGCICPRCCCEDEVWYKSSTVQEYGGILYYEHYPVQLIDANGKIRYTKRVLAPGPPPKEECTCCGCGCGKCCPLECCGCQICPPKCDCDECCGPCECCGFQCCPLECCGCKICPPSCDCDCGKCCGKCGNCCPCGPCACCADEINWEKISTFYYGPAGPKPQEMAGQEMQQLVKSFDSGMSKVSGSMKHVEDEILNMKKSIVGRLKAMGLKAGVNYSEIELADLAERITFAAFQAPVTDLAQRKVFIEEQIRAAQKWLNHPSRKPGIDNLYGPPGDHTGTKVKLQNEGYFLRRSSGSNKCCGGCCWKGGMFCGLFPPGEGQEQDEQNAAAEVGDSNDAEKDVGKEDEGTAADQFPKQKEGCCASPKNRKDILFQSGGECKKKDPPLTSNHLYVNYKNSEMGDIGGEKSDRIDDHLLAAWMMICSADPRVNPQDGDAPVVGKPKTQYSNYYKKWQDYAVPLRDDAVPKNIQQHRAIRNDPHQFADPNWKVPGSTVANQSNAPKG